MSRKIGPKEVGFAITLFEEAGWPIDTDYSGRSMYGQRCLSVTVNDERSLLGMILDLKEVESDFEDEGITRILANTVKIDGMGHDIVAYWPQFNTDHLVPNVQEPDDV